MTVNRSDFQRRFKAEPDSGDRFIGMDVDDGSGDPFITDLAGMAGGLAPLIAVDTELSSRFAPIARRMKAGQYYGPSFDGLDTTGTANLNGLYTVPLVIGSASQLLDLIGIEVTTGGSAGAVIRLGIYADDGSGYPGELVVETDALASTGTGAVSATIDETLAGGLYWLGIVAQVATCIVRCKNTASSLVGENSVGAASVGGYLQAGVTGALPATFTSTVFAHQFTPKIQVRAANP